LADGRIVSSHSACLPSGARPWKPQVTRRNIEIQLYHFYTPLKGLAFIPVEFQIAYRFGHSLVRPSYRANLAGDHGEAFIGLLQTDPNSYVNVQPYWKPTLPTKTGNPDDFRMIDFLTWAGVDPASRGQ